mgnify:FL=1
MKGEIKRYLIFNFKNNISNGTIHVIGHQTYDFVSESKQKNIYFKIYSENVQKIMNGNCNGNGHLSSEEEGDQERENHIEL